MYETFFGLKRRPFLFVPDMESYFSVDFMEESRELVERAVRQGEGISLIFGAVGTGKSLLMQILQQSLETEYTAILVSNSRLETPKALFLQLAHDLRLSRSGDEIVELRLQILDFARQTPSRGVVLLFDEAQHLSPSVLEEIRLLTEPVYGSVPLFRAILTGTPEFEEKLTFPKLEAFNQRVVSRCYLDSFTGEETSQYVVRQTDDLRLDPPHTVPFPLFTEAAKRRVYQLTGGVPRIINQLCGTALQFASEQEKTNVDETLVNDAWSSLQHIEPVETDQDDSPTVLESVIPPEKIAELVDQKRKTFQIRQFHSVEFGTLTDTESEPDCVSRSVLGNDYKPPYPEDDNDFADVESGTEDEALPPCRVLPIRVSVESEESAFVPAIPSTEAVAVRKCRIVPNFYKQEKRFRRRQLLQKIQHRLGLFAGLFQKSESQQPESPNNGTDMDVKTLQEYGAAVLDCRPPFVRKEPFYAYQTPVVSSRQDVTYPDPKTGVPITLCWLSEHTEKNERFGVSYTEFLNREQSPEQIVPEGTVEQPQPLSVLLEPEESPIVRTSLKASLDSQAVPSHCSAFDESFEESQQVGDLAISLADLFRAKSSELQRIEVSSEFQSLDETIRCQLEAVVKRIIKAAEKIEKAADVSEQAGRHVSQVAEIVEAEVKSALPTYTDLFKQWSEFQDMISSELESLRQRDSEQPKFCTFPRRQVMIERTVPTIDVELLLR